MKLSGLIFLFMLVGCSTPQTATAIPTLQTLTITLTPAVQPLEEAIHLCAVLQPEVALVVNELPAAFIGKSIADLAIQFGEPRSIKGYAAIITQENIAIIIHPDNLIKALNLSQLHDLFTGQAYSWDKVGGSDHAVQIWTYPENDDVRQVFDNAILSNDSLSSEAMLSSDPSQMIREISADPGAIGYVPASWLSPQVKAVELTPDLLTALRQPILALAPADPQGATRRFLSCLQSGAGQTELSKKYHP
jgi:hypothetical protein